MNSINIDINSLKNNYMNTYDELISNLNDAINQIEDLNLPSNYHYLDKIKTLSEKINEIKNKELKMRNTIEDIINLTNKINTTINDTLETIRKDDNTI